MRSGGAAARGDGALERGRASHEELAVALAESLWQSRSGTHLAIASTSRRATQIGLVGMAGLLELPMPELPTAELPTAELSKPPSGAASPSSLTKETRRDGVWEQGEEGEAAEAAAAAAAAAAAPASSH